MEFSIYYHHEALALNGVKFINYFFSESFSLCVLVDLQVKQ